MKEGRHIIIIIVRDLMYFLNDLFNNCITDIIRLFTLILL